MGILNVTPDSFSDGGEFTSRETMARQIAVLLSDGADIIDVGGESSRPFAKPVSLDEELARVIPAVEIIRQQSADILISIDTTKAEVARQALAKGANIINDISALRFDPQMIKVAKEYQCPIIIMHMQGKPSDMQVNPIYDDIIEETIIFFRERLKWLSENGVNRKNIIIDPGIGFGKTVKHNLTIINNLEKYQILGCRVLLGHSRKSFLRKLLGDDINLDQATAVISALGITKKIAILRVHEVKINREAALLTHAIAKEIPCH